MNKIITIAHILEDRVCKLGSNAMNDLNISRYYNESIQ